MRIICMMRDLYKALAQFETAFLKEYNISLNEAMVLCSLREEGGKTTPTVISKRAGMNTSLVSKTLRTIEEKGLTQRSLGKVDKRQMYYTLTPKGIEKLNELSLEKMELDEKIKEILSHKQPKPIKEI